jgi:threonine/homoserine/homoserine lactone efflux protein
MDYLLPLIIGFAVAFLGLIQPGMLNMTAAKTSLDKGKKEGLKFAFGASVFVIIQSFIAVTFAKYLVQNPNVISWLKKIAIFVLIGLSIFFYLQAKKQFKGEGKDKKGNSFVVGFLMSSINMLAIPFYLIAVTWAEKNGFMEIKQPYTSFFVVGTVLGSFTIFAIYANFAEKIAEKAQFLAKNINYILSVLFLILALLTVYQVYVS